MRTYSRRELYALGETLGESATVRKVGGGLILGGGGGGNQTSTGTTYTSNIPEYAKPYVETMLGATQKQLFTGNDTADGGYNITGFKPYQPYSTNASDYVAPFSPLQQKAQQTVGGMQVPGQFQTASDVTGAGIMGAAQVGRQAGSLYGMGNAAANAGNQYAQQATDPYSMAAYMSPYMQNVLQGQMSEAVRQSEMQGIGNKAQAVQAGAFGGSRQALVEAERQRNLGTQLGGIQAQGLQNAFQNAQQAQQYGAGLNLQGLQAGAGMYGQGIGAQQAGINQMMQGANQYAGLGAQQLQAEQGIANMQNTVGAQMQSQEQQKINQAIQDYANAQQYPLMQLGTMSNMLRGLPMQAQTTQQYVAAPNAVTQGIGAAGTAASIYNATKAEGGVIKSMAQGGITSVPSYDVGGEVKGQLANMDMEELEKQANGSPSRTVREMAKELLREKQMARVPQGAAPTGPMGVDYQAPQMAGGGIIAFKKGDRVYDDSGAPPVGEEEASGIPLDQSPTGGILGNASTPLAKPAPAPMPEFTGPTANLQKSLYEQNQLANRPVAELAAEKEAAMGPNVAAQEYRKQVMDERANSKDEATRQRWMRAAQFFAKWGSTPGPVLVAGMNALNEKLPDIISDEQTYKKAKRDIDKTILDLDNATRLEKAGYAKEAREDINKAAERAMHINQYLGSYMSSENVANINKSSHIEVEKLRGSVQRDIKAMEAERRKFDKEEASDLKKQSQLKDALSLQANTETKITNLMKNDDYQKLVRDASADPKKYPKLATTIKEAEKELKKRNEDFERLRKDTQELVDYHRDRSGFNKAKEDKKDKEGNDPLKVR
jgi:hypothetical protein